jgi:aminopeptidase N
MNKHLIIKVLILSLFVSSCNIFSGTKTKDSNAGNISTQENKEEKKEEKVERKRYNASKTRVNDLLHVKLEVSFDYEKTQMNGKAYLSLKPYFYETDSLVLDAKGFDLIKVSLMVKGNPENLQDLKYEYNNKQILIALDRKYKKEEKYHIYVEYIAKPEEIEVKGSAAITSDKGLYFINPDNSDENKPRQIWTQGETEASSCWYPTIDAPNERMTQEIYITLDTNDVSLSNGVLNFSIDNGDGTKTDYWKFDHQHAPYLTMMTIGDFAIVKDKWRDIEVNYYVEKDYKDHAKAIFGNTPEMIEFFSNKLNYKYPWDKYHQIVVRDYVSGAMENTGAVIFGDFVQKTTRELIDDDHEAIIAHELFHHWFGDLVTCESWANLPLNESFATYGEYLWFEHKFGRDKADEHGQKQLSQYLMEARQKQVDMIRFDYVDKEDMFDSHSYAKGGRILHVLRNYVGDDAFFKSLEIYLKENEYTAVEIHNLRLAFEKVTGEDLNWFFNQWFFASGHPNLEINYSYNEATKQTALVVEQKQNFEKTPLYKLPVKVDVYADGKVKTHHIVIENVKDTFYLASSSQPDLVNFDSQKMLLAEKTEKKSDKEWAFMFKNAPLYLDRVEALNKISTSRNDTLACEIIDLALNDAYSSVKVLALKKVKRACGSSKEEFKSKIENLLQTAKESNVRAEAITQLSELFPDDKSLENLYVNALKDSSYMVIGQALEALNKTNSKLALSEARKLENEKNNLLMLNIATIYSATENPEYLDFFVEKLSVFTGFEKYGFVSIYTQYLLKLPPSLITKSLSPLYNVAVNEGAWWMRLAGIKGLFDIHKKASEFDNDEEYINLKNKAADYLSKIKETETHPNLIGFLSQF